MSKIFSKVVCGRIEDLLQLLEDRKPALMSVHYCSDKETFIDEDIDLDDYIYTMELQNGVLIIDCICAATNEIVGSGYWEKGLFILEPVDPVPLTDLLKQDLPEHAQ